MLGAVALFVLDGCAAQECDFHSQCGERRYCDFGKCKQDCRRDVDCDDPQLVCSEIGQCVPAVDGGPGMDAGPDPGMDAGPGVDAFTPPTPDAGPPPDEDAGPGVDAFTPPTPDAGSPPGTGRYLDRCTGDGDCASGHCVDDVGGSRMCTIPCTTHRDCASEHVCGDDARCHPDDTGATCSTSSPTSCELGLCVGNASVGTGHCTRQCTNASDCPAGYACADAGGTFVCVDIEKDCSDGSQCATGLCLSVQGCTAPCRTAADCPRRFGFLPPYTCEVAFGSTTPICVPPDDVVGADPIGASCPATGTTTCRSGGCDTAAPLGPMCTQACTQEGGCGPGLGCFPQVDGGDIVLLCARAGSRALGASCSSGRECASGLCDATGSFCTRLCTDDGLCPTGMRCEPVAGFSISLCRR